LFKTRDLFQVYTSATDFSTSCFGAPDRFLSLSKKGTPWFRAEADGAFLGDPGPTTGSTSRPTSCEIRKLGFLFEKEILPQDFTVGGKRTHTAQAQMV